MRALILALAVGIAACSSLRDEGGCAKPCPSSCPSACLATGYCRSETQGPKSQLPTEFLSLPFGDFPPGAEVSISFNLVADVGDRDGTVPWDYWVLVQRLTREAPFIIDVSAFNTDAFPVIAAWTGTDVADADGTFNFDLRLGCGGRGQRDMNGECITLPGTMATITVVDPSPWEDPPACP